MMTTTTSKPISAALSASWRTVLALILGGAPALTAQSHFTAADEKSVLLPVQRAFVSLDVNQEKISLHAFQDRNIGNATTVVVCGRQVPKILDHKEWMLDLGFAAEEGKRKLVSSGDLVPGAELAVTKAMFREKGFVVPHPCPSPTETGWNPASRGYIAYFVTLKGDVVERKTAEVSGAAPTKTVALEDGVGGSMSLLFGVNRAFGRTRILGIGLSGAREWASPGEAEPQSACTLVASGTGNEGETNEVRKCEERFVGPLPDVWSGRLRVEWTQKLWRSADATGPSLGFLAATTATVRTELKPSYSIVIGPTLHPKDKPSNIVGAALFEFNDLTNTSGDHPTALKMFSLRLVVGVPL